jgi:long-chain acyl-CoA synthetase
MGAVSEQLRFELFAAREPHAPAVVDPRERRWSRGEIAALANRLANALRAAGLVAGDTVAIAAPNCAEYLAAYFGARSTGCYVVPINWHLAEPEVAYVLSDARPRALIAHGRLGAGRLDALRAHLPPGCIAVAIDGAPGYVSLASFIEEHAADPPDAALLGRVLPYTSATTGRPKAVHRPLRSARAALDKTIRWHRSLGLEPGTGHVHLCASMLYHVAPLEGAVIALEMGHAVVLRDRWDAAGLLEAIERHAVTTAFMVPVMLVRLLKLPEHVRRRYSCNTLRFVVHGGAPCPSEVKRAMIDWWGPILWEAYGSAEAQGTIASAEEWLERPGTVGRPIPGSAIRILDEHGHDLPPRAVGIVYIAPHTREWFEYRGSPEPERRQGEFVTVGDLGYLDEDGYLFLCDRRSDLIISSGMNVYPAEIEAQLIQHPAVHDCAVIGQKHELCGQVPIAIVEPVAGVAPDAVLSGELQRFLAERLTPMKLPKRIRYVERMPRDPSGKLFRRALREVCKP